MAVADGGEVLEEAEADANADSGGNDESGGDRRESRRTADRPTDCVCWDPEAPLPCWSCYREGFEEPNPEA
jgi:hypothetical protein